MAHRDVQKRVVMGLALVALLAAMNSADAQRRRLPSRTEPIPDTESGRPAGTSEPANPSMMIYGPPMPPLGAPPAPPTAEPSATPAPVATPPVAAPAPVITPIPATPAPVAVPVPAPVPPPAPVAVPTPPPPAPAPVAIPAPVVAPPPVIAPIAIPTPAPQPTPIVAPAPAVAPAPVAPVAIPAPVVPRPVAVPAPAPAPAAPLAIPAPAAPAPATRAIAAIAPAAAPFATPKLDGKLVEQIFSCLAPGLPQDWKKTWVVITNVEAAAGKERGYEAKFFYANSFGDDEGDEFVPCNAQEVSRRITGLSDALPPERRGWKTARLVIDNEGEFELKYDYTK